MQIIQKGCKAGESRLNNLFEIAKTANQNSKVIVVSTQLSINGLRDEAKRYCDDATFIDGNIYVKIPEESVVDAVNFLISVEAGYQYVDRPSLVVLIHSPKELKLKEHKNVPGILANYYNLPR